MDALLTVTSFGLSSLLPRLVQPPRVKQIHAPPLTIRCAAAQSFFLIALSICDFLPLSWMIILDEYLLSVAYRIVLMLLVACVLVVYPAVLGARLVGSATETWSGGSAKSTSQPNYCRRSNQRGWVGFCLKICSFAGNLAGILFQSLFLKPFCRLFGRRSVSTPSSASLLPTTNVQATKASGFSISCLSIVGSVVTIGLTIGFVSTVSPWFVRTTSHQQHFLSLTVSWLCALGIFLSSVVNGFGSVSLPYSCLVGLYLEPISDEAVHRAQQELKRTQQSIAKRREELVVESPVSGNSVARLSPRWSFSSPTSEERHQESRHAQLTQDIEFLGQLEDELQQEIYEMLESKELAAQARTSWGRFRSWLGVLFSIVLVLRLIGAGWFVWRHNHGGSRGTGSDLVTMTVLWLIGHNYVSQQQYNTVSQVISLLLTAYLSVAQVGTFVRAVDAVYRRLRQCWHPCSDAEAYDSSLRFQSLHMKLRSGSAYAPIVASLMSCYFLACVVLTKLLVPSAYRHALAVALETNDGSHDERQLLGFFLRIRSYAVNSVFLVTALFSMLALGMMLGLKRHQSLRHRAPVMVESA
jgi:hypothetical protein